MEPVFGVIKRWLGYEYVSLRVKGGLKAESSLIALSYNFKRAINVLVIKQLINRNHAIELKFNQDKHLQPTILVNNAIYIHNADFIKLANSCHSKPD